MRGNVLLAVITLMVAMLLLAPAILAGGGHKAGRKKGAAAAAGLSGSAHAVSHSHLHWPRRRDHRVVRARSNGPGLH